MILLINMILIVGEKPSVSRAISSVVGADVTKKGYSEGNGFVKQKYYTAAIHINNIFFH